MTPATDATDAAGAPPARRRAAIYVRISKAPVDADGMKRDEGIQRQEELCRERAAQLGWDVVVVYADNDTEASSGKPRRGYEAMLEDMRAGRINGVIGWHSDRIYRRPDELEDLIKIAEANDVQFSAVLVGNIDLSTASGRLVARLLGAAAKYETELKGERHKAQLKQLAYDGLPTGGGSRPFGYEKGWMSLNEPEAKVVRHLADRALAGESVNSLTEWLHDEGIRTVRGGTWHATVLRQILLNPRIAGLSTWEGKVVAKAKWPAIITEEEHQRLVALIDSGYGARRKRRPRVALLPGLIVCGRCGYDLITFHQQRRPDGNLVRVRAYGCRTNALAGHPGYRKACGSMSIKAEWAEDDVVERLIARLARPANARRLEDARRPPAEPGNVASGIAELEERLRELGVDYADGLIGRTEFHAARDRVNDRIAALEATRSAEPRIQLPHGDIDALVAWWEGAKLGMRQTVLRQYVERVVVKPHAGRRSHHDPERVTIDWR